MNRRGLFPRSDPFFTPYIEPEKNLVKKYLFY